MRKLDRLMKKMASEEIYNDFLLHIRGRWCNEITFWYWLSSFNNRSNLSSRI